MARARKPEEEHHISISISFDPVQYKELIAYCERMERPMAWVIRRALKTYLEEHKDDKI